MAEPTVLFFGAGLVITSALLITLGEEFLLVGGFLGLCADSFLVEVWDLFTVVTLPEVDLLLAVCFLTWGEVLPLRLLLTVCEEVFTSGFFLLSVMMSFLLLLLWDLPAVVTLPRIVLAEVDLLPVVCFLTWGELLLGLGDLLLGSVTLLEVGDEEEEVWSKGFCSGRAVLDEDAGRQVELCEEGIKALRAFLITTTHNIIT